MNYFEFYGINESFEIDAQLLKSKFLEMSRKFHPDFYANASEQEQNQALENSTFNTIAFNTLKDADKRTEYILKNHGVLNESEKGALPADFLADMMDINEQLMEYELEGEGNLDDFISQVNSFEKELIEAMQDASSRYSATEDKMILEEIKIIFLKKKYLLRIRESLNKFAPRS
jgi:molecular chaperone HscB